MFENLTDKLERSFKILKGEGRITEIIERSNRAHKGFNTLRDRATITGGEPKKS